MSWLFNVVFSKSTNKNNIGLIQITMWTFPIFVYFLKFFYYIKFFFQKKKKQKSFRSLLLLSLNLRIFWKLQEKWLFINELKSFLVDNSSCQYLLKNKCKKNCNTNTYNKTNSFYSFADKFHQTLYCTCASFYW